MDELEAKEIEYDKLAEEHEELQEIVEGLRVELSDQHDELEARETEVDVLRVKLDELVTDLQIANSLEDFQQLVVDLKWLSY